MFRYWKSHLALALLLVVIWLPSSSSAEDWVSKQSARTSLHRAIKFFRDHCSAGGGYIFRVSADLSKREGEGVVGESTAWLEPPATPTVGMAYLRAFQLTGEQVCLEAAVETAEALLQGQLHSGGWYHKIEFDTKDRQKYAYRVSGDNVGRRTNTTTFDDDKSQSAARFLMQLDSELEFKQPRIHRASRYALDCFVKAQYPNGAWPQRYSSFPEAREFPVVRASFPAEWPRKFPGADYKNFYTLNDDTISDLIVTMLDAYDVYGIDAYRQSAMRGGDFLLLAQLPSPQPGWAQQYNRAMHPAWARKFEPPAVTGGESQGVMLTLLQLYRRTKVKKYLEPIAPALKYYRSVQLADKRLARFYELGSNRPLYFTKNYELTYSDSDMPTHYGFKVGSRLDKIANEHALVLRTESEQLWKPKVTKAPRFSRQLQRRATMLCEALDARGAWVEEGRMRYHDEDATGRVIQSATFANNIVSLAEFVGARP